MKIHLQHKHVAADTDTDTHRGKANSNCNLKFKFQRVFDGGARRSSGRQTLASLTESRDENAAWVVFFDGASSRSAPERFLSLSLLFLYIFSLYAVRSVCVCRDPKTGPNPPVFSSSNQPPSSLSLFPPSIAINTHTPAGNIFPRIFFFFLLCQLWKRERDASTWNSKLDKHKRSVLTRIPPLFFPPSYNQKNVDSLCRFHPFSPHFSRVVPTGFGCSARIHTFFFFPRPFSLFGYFPFSLSLSFGASETCRDCVTNNRFDNRKRCQQPIPPFTGRCCT